MTATTLKEARKLVDEHVKVLRVYAPQGIASARGAFLFRNDGQAEPNQRVPRDGELPEAH
jgi:hypothetical protein